VTFVRVTGRIDGEPVWATWEDGQIYGDARLVDLARSHVDAGKEIPLTEDGPFVKAALDDAWSFTTTMSVLVDEPVVSGDDLPSVTVEGSRNSHASSQ
jgi:hypothetical protein